MEEPIYRFYQSWHPVVAFIKLYICSCTCCFLRLFVSHFGTESVSSINSMCMSRDSCRIDDRIQPFVDKNSFAVVNSVIEFSNEAFSMGSELYLYLKYAFTQTSIAAIEIAFINCILLSVKESEGKYFYRNIYQSLRHVTIISDVAFPIWVIISECPLEVSGTLLHNFLTHANNYQIRYFSIISHSFLLIAMHTILFKS
jgi:hypothetical protein